MSQDNLPPFWVHRSHHRNPLLVLLAIILVAAVLLLFIGVSEFAFEKVGFTRLEFTAILVATFLGSAVDIPLYQVRATVPIVVVQEVRAFWMTYRIPTRALRHVSTTVAVNLGGGVIPVLVSLYLLASHTSLILYAVAATVVTSILVHLVARRIDGVGIVTPAFLPPIFAAVAAFVFVPGQPAVVAYVCGTLGCLIGADLSNLNHVDLSGAQMESIGGAGTFDGVFLTGIMAVILAVLI